MFWVEGLPLPPLGPMMGGGTSRIFNVHLEMPRSRPGLSGSNSPAISTCSPELGAHPSTPRPGNLSAALRPAVCSKLRNSPGECTERVSGLLACTRGWGGVRRRLQVRGASHVCLVRLPLEVLEWMAPGLPARRAIGVGEAQGAGHSAAQGTGRGGSCRRLTRG